MRGLNKVTLIGQLGKDPEIKVLENGITVAKFPLATSESYKDKSGHRQEQTEWHNIVLWRGLAEIAQKYLHKGNMVYIEGKIQTRSWEVEGQRRHTTEIVAENMILLERKPNTNNSNITQDKEDDYPTSDQFKTGDANLDDLPF